MKHTDTTRGQRSRFALSPRRTSLRGVVLAIGTMAALSGCGPVGGSDVVADTAGSEYTTVAARPAEPATPVPPAPVRRVLPGVGPNTLAGIPSDARQVLLATGDGHYASTSTVRLHEREGGEWKPTTEAWPAHNGAKGWTDNHRLGDLRSPIGVSGLTAAGGLLPDPGTRLPYDRSGG